MSEISVSLQFFTLVFGIITAISVTVSTILVMRQTQPQISVMIEPDDYDRLSFNLIVENVGTGVAHWVKFQSVPDFKIFNDRTLSQIGMFKNGLRVLAPHQKYKIHLTWMPDNYEEKINNPIEIHVNYKSWCGFEKQDKFFIDFSLYGEYPVNQNPLSSIAKSLNEINTKFKP